jgi:hypothetical protein
MKNVPPSEDRTNSSQQDASTTQNSAPLGVYGSHRYMPITSRGAAANLEGWSRDPPPRLPTTWFSYRSGAGTFPTVDQV